MYFPLQKLGEGSFGRVVAARCRHTGELVAVKCLSKRFIAERRQQRHAESEAKALAAVRSPFVVRGCDAIETAKGLHLVMELCSGGDLFSVLQRAGAPLSEHAVRFCLASVAIGLQHCHEQGVLYRDLKPENVFIDGEGYPKLGEFGLCKAGLSKDSMFKGGASYCGTHEYSAPEVAAHDVARPASADRGAPAYGFACDWWSFGVMAFELLTGLPPFFACRAKRADVPMSLQFDFAAVPFPSHVSSSAKALVRALLVRDPAGRLGTRDGAAEVLSHAFFGGPMSVISRVNSLRDRSVRSPLLPLLPEVDHRGVPRAPAAPGRVRATFSTSTMDANARARALERGRRGDYAVRSFVSSDSTAFRSVADVLAERAATSVSSPP